jgi:glyoxylase-like metal-dependent hydrolase (beta-lactamase superfamily II)
MRTLPLFAHNPSAWTGAGNHTYLLVDGDEATLIDAGAGHPGHLEELRRALTGEVPPGAASRLVQVLVTHAHSDHAAGATALAAAYPGVRFAKYPWPEADARYGVPWTPLRDGEVVPVGTGRLRVVHTPGHAPDHVCFLDERSGVLFGGDLAVKGSTVVILASAGGSLAAYLDSLRRVLDLSPTRILPAHGDPIDEPRTLLRSYLDHRAARERQIAALVDVTPRTVDDLVTGLYTGLAPELVRAAAESVLAHLHKLRDERRVLEHTDAAGVTSWVRGPGA